MSYERFIQLHVNSVCSGVVGLFSARRFAFPVHVPSYSTPLRSALSFSLRRSAAELVICRQSYCSVESFAARCGSERFLRVTNLRRHASCLSTHLRSMLSLGLRSESDVQTCSASRLDVPAIAAMRGSRRFLRATEGSLRRAGSSATSFSAPCFRGGAFCGSTRALPRNSNAEVKANNALQRTAPRVTVAALSGSVPSRPCAPLFVARRLSLRSTPQLPRRAPQSLSLESLAVSSRCLKST